MNTLNSLEQQIIGLGYRSEAIFRDYPFDDFSDSAGHIRTAALAVFTQTPASYRSAAFGIASAAAAQAAEVVNQHRALGAPLFFVVEESNVSVWQVRATQSARLLDRRPAERLPDLFSLNRERWAPDAIHRAKAIGKFDSAYQLDFIDIGLLPAIEGQIHSKLDRLLNEVFVALNNNSKKRGADQQRHLFQGVFRLLAAKILIDRGHAKSRQWDVSDVVSVLNGIGNYYRLNSEHEFSKTVDAAQFRDAWKMLRESFNVSNISADDLAYVYENTLVTPAARANYGTHSTPRQVADFIAARLQLWKPTAASLKVFEPCTGAGVLLVAALRHLRGALPAEWSDAQKHTHLVKHLQGAEIDAFACEVATLSLILADYPNTNGWKIRNKDLFEGSVLREELRQHDVILCNPPFEPLNPAERKKYPDFASVGGNKAEIVLRLALEANPKALGFVLPRSFLMDRAYAWHRNEIERRFSHIEIISLPDRIFTKSKTESALVIAREPATAGATQTISVSEVSDRGRAAFLEFGETTHQRSEQRTMVAEPAGQLWLTPLANVWRHLASAPTLSTVVECHWGIRWNNKKQATAGSQQRSAGAVRGLMKAQDHRQFVLGKEMWVSTVPKEVYGGGDLPWEKPKILCNAIRSSRGAWRISAAVDRTGLVASQQFAVLWSTNESVDLDAVAAVINGPLGNAFMCEHTSDRRLRIKTFLNMPIPRDLPARVGDLARQYSEIAATAFAEALSSDPKALLDEIDALVLDAYDLPPKLVRALLATFEGAPNRPLVHDWESWGVTDESPALSLSELRSTWVSNSRAGWIQERLAPISGLEKDVAEVLWGSDE